MEAGAATVRYAITDRAGASVLDTGRPLAGPGAVHLDRALQEILGGSTRHAGALLSPFGIRFVVADEGVLPAAAADTLGSQLDLSLVPAVGLTIYGNADAIPPAAILDTRSPDREIMAESDPGRIVLWRPVPATPLERVRGGWDGPAREGTAFLSTEHDAGWMLEGTERDPDLAFGWATSFRATGAPVRIRHEGDLPARIQLGVLGLLWLGALWATRRPVAR